MSARAQQQTVSLSTNSLLGTTSVVACWKLAAWIVLIGSAFLFVASGDLPGISPTTALEAHISIPPEPKQPHYTKAKKEAPYNWQKCKDSNDTDCWKQEGERVHCENIIRYRSTSPQCTSDIKRES